MDEHGNLDIIDFSFSPEPHRFRINDDVFECTAELPLSALVEVANMKFDIGTLKDVGLEPVLKFFDTVMLDDSAKRFRERVDSKTQPIGMRHVMKIIPWLLEVYGMRPTEPSTPSSESPPSGGTTSTAGAPSTTSILFDNESLVSST